MKIKMLQYLKIFFVLILWALSGCKKSTTEPANYPVTDKIAFITRLDSYYEMNMMDYDGKNKA